MGDILTLGQMLTVHDRLQPDRIGARDLERQMTFTQWNKRACRLANGLAGLGLRRGDRIAVLAYNRVEWLEIFAAGAKAGLVVVPLNFRLVGKEVSFILEDAGAAAIIVQDQLAGVIEDIRGELRFPEQRIVVLGAMRCPAGWQCYEALIEAGADKEPANDIALDDPCMLLYTSGTTGNPKGAIRSHRANALLSLVTDIELRLTRDDAALLVMPMCHANSIYFFGAFIYCGAATNVYSRESFDPEHCARVLGDGTSTFTSLVPTHYTMMLSLPDATSRRDDLARVTKLMISSAPARPDTKRAVMDMFKNSGLYELYGSTEAGWVTMLHPDEQFTHLGTVGRECVGSGSIRFLDENGREVPDGEAGELFSHNAYTFDGYWNLPEKTAAAFRDGACSVGDIGRRDPAGYIRLVDRKSNMIISGGENVYPSEVEAVLGTHPAVREVAIIGLPHEKWGESVHAVVVLKRNVDADPNGLQSYCREHLAGHKRPRGFSFMDYEDMPRTATGKVLHRKLRTLVLESRA